MPLTSLFDVAIFSLNVLKPTNECLRYFEGIWGCYHVDMDVSEYGDKNISMRDSLNEKGIWFVYDGECPLCKTAALALKIKAEYGELHLLNARDDHDHWLIKEINHRKYDLDEGMIIHDGNRFYHGKDALRFMAKYGENKGVFNLLNKAMYWSDTVALVIYPWLRGIRNALLRRKSVKRIDNLNLEASPTFKTVFGKDWDDLPVVMKKHYANRPYTDDVTIVDGTLDVMCSGPIKMFAWLFWIMKGIPPQNEKNVSVTVNFESDKDSKSFHFNREFRFKKRRSYKFQSRMIQIKDDEMVEVMKSRLGWRMSVAWEDQRVKLKHRGYVLFAFGHFIPLPLTILLGRGDAEEVAVDENTFDMAVAITHPWWGKIYEYKGRFKVRSSG